MPKEHAEDQEEAEEGIELQEAPVEEVKEEVPTAQEMRDAGISEQEISMAINNGTAVKEKEEESEEEEEEEDEEAPKEGTEKTEDQLAKEIIANPDLKLEDLKKNKNFTPNVKNLYWEQKKARRRAQEAEGKIKEVSTTLDLYTVKAKNYETKFEKLHALLEGDENEVTQEAILAILGPKPTKEGVKDDKDRPLTARDLENKEKEDKAKADKIKAETERIQERLIEQKEIGEDRYGVEEFTIAQDLADEVLKSDKTGVYGQRVYLATLAEKPEEGSELCDVVMALAKLHPDYGKEIGEEVRRPKKGAKPIIKAEERSKIKRIIRNAEKKPAAPAGGSGGGGSKRVLEEDLTADDVDRMSDEQWQKLKPETRQRLKGG